MMDMRAWLTRLIDSKEKKPIPILSFPGVQLLGVTVEDLIADSGTQARALQAVADRCDTAAAAVGFMDLSVEAEAFGAAVRFSAGEVPTIPAPLIDGEEAARALPVPPPGAGRTSRYIEAIGQAARLITDRPVFGGVIGPFSLAGRLMGMTEAMIASCTQPDIVHILLRKATEFIISYVNGYKDAGAHGVVMAEPAAGILSPALNDAFSTPYVREIVGAAQDDTFLVLYHNCGNTLPLLPSILSNGAAAYHFGNAVAMDEVLERVPGDVAVMGNLDPSGLFHGGTPESVREGTRALMAACGKYRNFIPSSGCDIPPLTPWENIDAFFGAVREYYGQ
ncbi:MAG: methyltransferase [Clostridiales bacterium]|nr:methyltransferase [Clostridiales bacterium]